MINREFALRRKFMHHLFLVLVLSALPATAAERWEVLPPTPAPVHSERSGQANDAGEESFQALRVGNVRLEVAGLAPNRHDLVSILFQRLFSLRTR
jgi:hypothetical protein